jgi:hypothetical protein
MSKPVTRKMNSLTVAVKLNCAKRLPTNNNKAIYIKDNIPFILLHMSYPLQLSYRT